MVHQEQIQSVMNFMTPEENPLDVLVYLKWILKCLEEELSTLSEFSNILQKTLLELTSSTHTIYGMIQSTKKFFQQNKEYSYAQPYVRNTSPMSLQNDLKS